MRNWQDMPASTNVQDMTYGPQLPHAPWNMGPKQPPIPSMTAQDMMARMMYLGQQTTPEQNQALQRIGFPSQLPLNPIAGSQPSGLTFAGNTPVATDKPGQRWQGGPPTYVPDQPISYQPRRGPQFMPDSMGTTLNSIPWGAP